MNLRDLDRLKHGMHEFPSVEANGGQRNGGMEHRLDHKLKDTPFGVSGHVELLANLHQLLASNLRTTAG